MDEQQRLAEEKARAELERKKTLEAVERERAQIGVEEYSGAAGDIAAAQGARGEFLEDQEARLTGQIKTFSDRLRDRRAATELATQRAGEHFAGAFETDVPRDPASIFRGFQTFETAARGFIEPLEQQQFQTEQLLAGIQASKLQNAIELLKLSAQGQDFPGLGLQGFEGELTPSNILSLAGQGIEDKSAAKRYRELLSEISQLRDLQRAFQQATPSGNRIVNMLDPTTGWIGRIMGTGLGSTEDRELRSSLMRYFSEERHRLYGSVLTEGETKEALRTIPHTGAQETDNIFRIDASLKDKGNELVGLFQDEGFPENDITMIVASTGVTPGDEQFWNDQATMVGGAQVGKEGSQFDPYIKEAEEALK